MITCQRTKLSDSQNSQVFNRRRICSSISCRSQGTTSRLQMLADTSAWLCNCLGAQKIIYHGQSFPPIKFSMSILNPDSLSPPRFQTIGLGSPVCQCLSLYVTVAHRRIRVAEKMLVVCNLTRIQRKQSRAEQLRKYELLEVLLALDSRGSERNQKHGRRRVLDQTRFGCGLAE